MLLTLTANGYYYYNVTNVTMPAFTDFTGGFSTISFDWCFLIPTSNTDTVYLLIFVMFLLYPIPFRTGYAFQYSFPPITKPPPNTKN